MNTNVKKRLSDPERHTVPASTPVRLADRTGVQFFGLAKRYFGDLSPHGEHHEATYKDHRILEQSSDFKIRDELGGWSQLFLSDPATIDSMFGRLIDSGVINKDGDEYICYFRNPSNADKALYVRVYWWSDDSEWYVSIRPADHDPWRPGNHILTAAAAED